MRTDACTTRSLLGSLPSAVQSTDGVSATARPRRAHSICDVDHVHCLSAQQHQHSLTDAQAELWVFKVLSSIEWTSAWWPASSEYL